MEKEEKANVVVFSGALVYGRSCNLQYLNIFSFTSRDNVEELRQYCSILEGKTLTTTVLTAIAHNNNINHISIVFTATAPSASASAPPLQYSVQFIRCDC